jgi:hypothetical protein
MKRGMWILLSLILVILVISQVNIVHSAKYEKIDKNILSKLSDNKNVSVMIKFKETNKKQISLEKNIVSIKKKIRHKFSNSVSATISKEDLTSLEKNNQIESITLLGTKKIFLQDSV